jgi:hypothetical protein
VVISVYVCGCSEYVLLCISFSLLAACVVIIFCIILLKNPKELAYLSSAAQVMQFHRPRLHVKCVTEYCSVSFFFVVTMETGGGVTGVEVSVKLVDTYEHCKVS